MDSGKFYLCGFNLIETDEVFLSVESFISLFVYQYCDMTLEICILNVNETYPFAVPKQRLKGLKYSISNADDFKDLSFSLPAIVTDEGKTVISGLCAALRWAIKTHLVSFPNHPCKCLLGFRGGCLVACTESSIWTKFCELQLPNSVKDTSLRVKSGEILTEVPESLVLLETHLERPVRTHNILKRKLDIAKKIKQNNVSEDSASALKIEPNFTLYDQNCKAVNKNDLKEKLKNMSITEKTDEFCLDHCFLEGIDLTLADMVVFPCVHYLLKHLPSQGTSHLKNVAKWYKNMCLNMLVREASEKVGIALVNDYNFNQNHINEACSTNVVLPDVSQISLYTRDPSHTKLKCKHQSPDKIISLLFAANILPKYNTSYCTNLDWDSLPSMLHPANGDLPAKRLQRKCEQLESIVTAVLKIAKDNQVIVEFCAGGGHVGLLLAHYLPSCKVVLIENKESSMMRAKHRASKLNLKNVFFYQCNLDYFKGSFDIGVSLHACGVATDLVMRQCIIKRASFVCCPCCYGNIQDTHLLTYPLSKKFQSTDMSKKDYTLLAHFADRNEINTPTAEKGEVCMGLIDTDRIFYAEEQGYKMDLTTLQPITCSPKHNLLIGLSPLQLKISTT